MDKLIWGRNSSPGDLENVELSFIAITLRSILTNCGCTYQYSIYESIDMFIYIRWKYLMLYNLIIRIENSYLVLYLFYQDYH